MPHLQGQGQTRQVKKYRVNIPAGVRDGSRVRLAGKGEPGRRGGPPGDLYVITRVSESPVFRRKGENLEVEVPVTIVEAIRGATIDVPTLNGKKRIRVPAGTQHGTVQRLRGEGPPKLSGRGRGDIHYRLQVDVPKFAQQGAERGVEALAEVMEGNPREGLFKRERDGDARADKGVYMISVAAELAGVHPQTLRIYEARGLIKPNRSPGHAALLAGRRREAAPDPGAHERARDEPGRRGARLRARGGARADALAHGAAREAGDSCSSTRWPTRSTA